MAARGCVTPESPPLLFIVVPQIRVELVRKKWKTYSLLSF